MEAPLEESMESDPIDSDPIDSTLIPRPYCLAQVDNTVTDYHRPRHSDSTKCESRFLILGS